MISMPTQRHCTRLKKDYWNEISTKWSSQLLYSVVVLQMNPLTIKNGLSLTTYRLDGISIESFNVGSIIAKEWTYVSQGSMIKNFKEG